MTRNEFVLQFRNFTKTRFQDLGRETLDTIVDSVDDPDAPDDVRLGEPGDYPTIEHLVQALMRYLSFAVENESDEADADEADADEADADEADADEADADEAGGSEDPNKWDVVEDHLLRRHSVLTRRINESMTAGNHLRAAASKAALGEVHSCMKLLGVSIPEPEETS